MTLTTEQRDAIRRRMKGNRNATGNLGRIRFAYRPAVYLSNTLASLIHRGNSPLDFDWRGQGYIGISTNDADRAAAWVTKAQELGYNVRDSAARTAPHGIAKRKLRLTPNGDCIKDDTPAEPWDTPPTEPWDVPEPKT